MKSNLKIIFTFLLFPFMSQAHVTLEPKAATAGDYAKLVFRVPHGCDGSPTVKISVQIPEGVLSVKPMVHTGWEISLKKTKLAKPVSIHGKETTEGISEVSWSGGPLSDDYMDEFAISLHFPDLAGDKLVFPVTQDCVKGSAKWPDLSLTLNAAPKGSEHQHHH